jgi:hypothetical protein
MLIKIKVKELFEEQAKLFSVYGEVEKNLVVENVPAGANIALEKTNGADWTPYLDDDGNAIIITEDTWLRLPPTNVWVRLNSAADVPQNCIARLS